MNVGIRFNERGFGLASFLESLLLVFGYALLVFVIVAMLSGPALWQDQPISNSGTSGQSATRPAGN